MICDPSPPTQANTSLATLLLRDNPLGQLGAQHLLHALDRCSDAFKCLDLLGCSFQDAGQRHKDNLIPATHFSANQPDGSYKLDLAQPAHLIVAWQLVDMAATQGAMAWQACTLNGRPFKLQGTSRAQVWA